MNAMEEAEYTRAVLGLEELDTMLQVLDQSQLLDHPDNRRDVELGATMLRYIAKRASALRASMDDQQVPA